MSLLPDELVKDVLHSILDIPDHKFHDTSAQSPFAHIVASSSNTLLVCKRWMRIATPLLYHKVILRSPATVLSFCLAIRRQPTFAKLVRHLRVECACPNIIGDTAKKMTALKSLHLNLDSLIDEQLLGATKLLAASNAIHVSLAQSRLLFDFFPILLKRLSVLSKWKNLRVLTLPQYDSTYISSHVTPILLNVVASCMVLDEIQLPVAKPCNLDRLDQAPDVERRIRSAAKAGVKPIITFVTRDWRFIDPKVFESFESDGKAHRIVHFRGRPSISSEIYDLGDLAAAHPTSEMAALWSTHLENAPADVRRKIWQRITGYTIFNEQRQMYRRRVWFAVDGLDFQSAGAMLLLNKEFSNIVLSTLAEAVELGKNSGITANLASQLRSRPEIAPAVKNLSLRWYTDRISGVVAKFSQLRRLNLLLERRIDLIRLLESFDAFKGGLRALSVQLLGYWGTAAIGVYLSHRRKVELSHSDDTTPAADESAPIPDASRLVIGMVSLTSLYWNFPYAFFITPPNPNTLLALTDLGFTVDSESASRWLAKCQLPLLTKLTLLSGGAYVRESDEFTPEPYLKLFLATHGSKIKQLCLRSYPFPVGELLQACPNVEYMVANESVHNFADFSNVTAPRLKTIRVEFSGTRDWIENLVTAICGSGFCALEQLVVKTTSSHEFWNIPGIANVEEAAETPWQGDAAEKLKARGVALTDTEGRTWRPRLAIQDVLRRSSRITAKPSGRR